MENESKTRSRMADGDNAVASSSRHTLSDIQPAPRVSQVDADELDEGLVGMLGERLEKSLGLFKESWSTDLKPEIALVLKLVIFRYSFLGPRPASPGARLQNLRLVGRRGNPISRGTLLLYLLLHPPIFPSYILTRLRNLALSRQWADLPRHDIRRKMWRTIVRLENLAKAWELAGWGMFLWDGRYPSLLMRILGVRLVPASPHLTKLVSYEFMNRQLVWGAFTEFLLYGIPMLPSIPSVISPTGWMTHIKAAFSPPPTVDYTALPIIPTPANGSTNTAAHSGRYAGLPARICPICYSRTHDAPVEVGAHISLPSLGSGVGGPHSEGRGTEWLDADDEEGVFVPTVADCWGGCQYCYYCIAQELAKWREEEDARAKAGPRPPARKAAQEETRGWECWRCGGIVTSAQRVGPPLLSDPGLTSES